VFLQGLFFMDLDKIPKKLEDSKRYLCKFNNYCKELNLTKNEFALSFVNSVAQNSILLFGCDNLKQAVENIKLYNNLEVLGENKILEIVEQFKDVPESIYNPSKWYI
jgi:aryl-alcohol dehydrogenase-like predicted oxidoreductase